MDKVSIYISTFNRLERLKRAVASVLAQDYPEIEILICDDASTDGTKEFVELLSKTEPKIKYIRNLKNKGACVTRNLGIYSATGKFITGLDDDDEFTKDRISNFVQNWDNDFSFLCCNFTNVYSNNKKEINYKQEAWINTFTYKDLLYENKASNQIFTLTERLKNIGGFDAQVKRLQDWDTWLRLSYKYGDFKRLNIPTYMMHHNHSIEEMRVSTSYSYADALEDFINRNNHIYGQTDGFCMKNTVAYHKRQLSIGKAIKWMFLTKNPKNLARYFYQFFDKKNV
ncbi:glycosyltransferase [Sodalis sp. RH21]|uniref:glycosyltransferase n=1 Tax=unclassified Sodalis (in: enterobacteria) TaxID=2636512 RepID=UPI0039B49FB3